MLTGDDDTKNIRIKLFQLQKFAKIRGVAILISFLMKMITIPK